MTLKIILNLKNYKYIENNHQKTPSEHFLVKKSGFIIEGLQQKLIASCHICRRKSIQ